MARWSPGFRLRPQEGGRYGEALSSGLPCTPLCKPGNNKEPDRRHMAHGTCSCVEENGCQHTPPPTLSGLRLRAPRQPPLRVQMRMGGAGGPLMAVSTEAWCAGRRRPLP